MKNLVIIRDHSILEDTILGFMRAPLDVTYGSAEQTLKGPDKTCFKHSTRFIFSPFLVYILNISL